MIDCVKLIFRHQAHQMGKFDRNDAFRLEKNLHACDEIVQIRYLGEHIIAEQQIRLPAFGRELSCGPLAKESH